MCQGYGHFSDFLLHLVFAKLATSNIRVNPFLPAATIEGLDVLVLLTDFFPLKTFFAFSMARWCGLGAHFVNSHISIV